MCFGGSFSRFLGLMRLGEVGCLCHVNLVGGQPRTHLWSAVMDAACFLFSALGRHEFWQGWSWSGGYLLAPVWLVLSGLGRSKVGLASCYEKHERRGDLD
jgi:hypothetical protein